ncbi:pectate lyase, partial [Streptomyces lavenduligriseus]|nr:pectate lyase [Streptomyces lavenduligriseus]
MSTRTPRHRRSRAAFAAGLPLALAAAGGLGYGLLGPGGSSDASAANAVPAWATQAADGFASVNALGQNGTYGGRGGEIVTVKTLADLEKYATAD